MSKIRDLIGKETSSDLKEKVDKSFSKEKERLKKLLKINDVRKKLPHHPTKTWSVREEREVYLVIVHQSLVRCPPEKGFKNLKSISTYLSNPKGNHISKTGCPGFCYHYAIDRDGKIYYCNEEKFVTWHCKGKNRKSVGICVLGNFSGPSYKGKQKPSDAQLESLKNLLDYLKVEKRLYKVYGHHDWGKENCPGTVIYDFLLRYKKGKI